jgi:hypothetical protein
MEVPVTHRWPFDFAQGRPARIAAAALMSAIGALSPATASGQGAFVAASVCPDDNHATFHACALAAARTFNPPRTADGEPDLSGYWRRRVAAFEDFEAHPRTPDDSGGPDVVVDPADGKVPMQPWADAKRKENAAKYLHHNAACLLAGGAGTMYMANLYQFLQTRDYFLVIGEGLSAHPYRIVPLDGRPHIGAGIRLWQGDPVGRWEGNTLVIETTNQNGRPFVDQRGRFFTEEARTLERLTLVDANTMHYEATFEDPNVYTRPFTMAFAYRRNAVQGAEVWEEACYEANQEQMELFRNNGLRVYPGISAAEARELRRTWESRQP